MRNILKKNLASYDTFFHWSVNFRGANSVSVVLNLVFAICNKIMKAKKKNLLPRDDRKCNKEHFEKKFDLLRYFLSLKRKFSWDVTTWKPPISRLACMRTFVFSRLFAGSSINICRTAMRLGRNWSQWPPLLFSAKKFLIWLNFR